MADDAVRRWMWAQVSWGQNLDPSDVHLRAFNMLCA